MHIDSIPTPALVLNAEVMNTNIQRMAKRCRDLGVALRPHVKTPKSIPVVRVMSEAGAKSFAVSTLKEAEYLFAAGFDDLFYAVPLDPAKVPARCEFDSLPFSYGPPQGVDRMAWFRKEESRLYHPAPTMNANSSADILKALTVLPVIDAPSSAHTVRRETSL